MTMEGWKGIDFTSPVTRAKRRPSSRTNSKDFGPKTPDALITTGVKQCRAPRFLYLASFLSSAEAATSQKVKKLYHPVYTYWLHYAQFQINWLNNTSLLELSSNLISKPGLKFERRNSLAGLFAPTSRDCCLSVQFGGTIT